MFPNPHNSEYLASIEGANMPKTSPKRTSSLAVYSIESIGDMLKLAEMKRKSLLETHVRPLCLPFRLLFENEPH